MYICVPTRWQKAKDLYSQILIYDCFFSFLTYLLPLRCHFTHNIVHFKDLFRTFQLCTNEPCPCSWVLLVHQLTNRCCLLLKAIVKKWAQVQSRWVTLSPPSTVLTKTPVCLIWHHSLRQWKMTRHRRTACESFDHEATMSQSTILI